MWAAAASRTAGSASRAGLEQRVVGDRERQVARQLADGVVDADGGRGAAVGRLGQVPLAERVEGRADLRQPAEVALGRLGAGDGHRGHRLEDQALPADVALGRRVGGPERVLGVGPGALDQRGQHPLVDPLGVGEAGRVDRRSPGGRWPRAPAAARSLASRLGSKESPSNSVHPEQGGVVRVVAVLGGEVRLAEPGELGRGVRWRRRGASYRVGDVAGQKSEWPPSMEIVCPLTQPASGAAKNSTPRAMSYGVAGPAGRDVLEQGLLAVLAVAVPLRLGGRVREHESGCDAVDGDAERPQLVCHLPGEADLAGLGRGVGLDAGEADAAAGPGGDVDDPPVAGGASSAGRRRGCS